jgi:hypothetical protein
MDHILMASAWRQPSWTAAANHKPKRQKAIEQWIFWPARSRRPGREIAVAFFVQTFRLRRCRYFARDFRDGRFA